MPSRQERRKAERDAAKRAPGQAGAGEAGGAAAAPANLNVNVNPGGDWTTQAENPVVLVRALGAELVKQRAGAGDREAQFSLGYGLVTAADGAAGTKLGAGGRSPKAEAGLALGTARFPVSHQTAMRRCGHLTLKRFLKTFCLRVPTLGGGRLGASGEGGGDKGTRTLCLLRDIFTTCGRNTSKP